MTAPTRLVAANVEHGQADDAALDLSLAKARFRLYDRNALDNLPEPDPVIAGLLAKGVSMLAGERGLGKSLLALSMAGAVATDLPTWMGMDVCVHGPVLYVAMEGFYGVPERVHAWECWSHRRAEQITWMHDPINLRREQDAVELGQIAQELGAVAVFVDSARATGAGDEGTGDMGQYVHGLETVQRIAGGSVITLHNAGWDGKRERGSTVLPDACETTLILEGRPNGTRVLSHRKFRDGPWMEPLSLIFSAVEGTTSGVLLPSSGPALAATLPQLVLEAVKSSPGRGTGDYADLVGKHRPNVSTAMRSLQVQGLVHNNGTAKSPSWVLAQQPLVPA